ncbi:MAG: HlyD family efflux transporter periplasmic adaptor subunit [Waltera sp.]
MRTMVRAEQALTSDAVVFVYSNPKELTVTVSVDQSDIAKLTVGDSAYVQSSAGSGYTGVITAIDPVSSSRQPYQCHLQRDGTDQRRR